MNAFISNLNCGDKFITDDGEVYEITAIREGEGNNFKIFADNVDECGCMVFTMPSTSVLDVVEFAEEEDDE
jgi:hypothetical protein